ncbi:MAG TPA: UDP-N-acetylmuramate dehydrogenase [Thermoanaerobaculia bacterium]|nr:UDP-N-acetylmuramate dehydrogenase [Thermoanaerobaculia bacterium]HQP86932.1 UDP-N-acetylmuramate dehydrogenase [Thermoanaerobaculia bacterium]
MIDTSPLTGLRLRLRPEEPLAPRTTWRIGGPARFFAEVEDAPALAALLRWARAEKLPAIPLGKGSNVLVPDEGLDAVVFVLSGELAAVSVEAPLVRAGGGASLMSLAVTARNASLSGTEGLSGIPSSVGGAVRINAGAYGAEIFDLLEEVTLVSRSGALRVVPAASIPHGYRWSALCDGDDVVASATLRLRPATREEVDARLAEVRERRRKALPTEPNAGSVFKNPPGDHAGRLLEACGLKGERVGGAVVSERHANVIVNAGGATAADVRALMARMRDAVRDRFGVDLVPEVEDLGRFVTNRNAAASVESGR